jgi:hypothetical protein
MPCDGRIDVAKEQLEEADEVVRVPLARLVGLPEPELAPGRQTAEEP